jgi:prevent-host-death family protein
MKTATISTLKAKLSEHIAYVKRGEEVIVTERGKPVAMISPIARSILEDERLCRLAARGAIRPGRGNMLEVLKEIQANRRDIPIEVIKRVIREGRDEDG